MVTSPGIDPAAVFVKMRQIIGAGEQYSATTRTETEHSWQEKYASHSMEMGQGLPALMWVDFAHPGQVLGGEGHDEDCESDCDGGFHDPAGYIEINYDTAYGYRADNNASCGDLHAFITREIGAWLDMQGATWKWYDESGWGWFDDLTTPKPAGRDRTSPYGTLGDPNVGALDSTICRSGAEDEKRAFGALAVAAVLANEAGA